MNEDLPVLDELERRLISACYRSPSGAPNGGRARRGPRWVWATVGLSGAACVAVAVVAIAFTSGSVQPTAAQALDRAAGAAAVGRAVMLGVGQYWYTRTIYSSTEPIPIVPRTIPAGSRQLPPTVPFYVSQSIETWIGTDGTIRRRETTLSQRYANAAARRRWVASGEPFPRLGGSDSITGGDGWFPPGSGAGGDLGDGLFNYGQLISLPTAVGPLGAAIERAQAALQRREQHGLSMQIQPGVGVGGMQIIGGQGGLSPAQRRAIEDLNTIASLLSTPVTPAVRAALYRVAASLPGVAYDGSARDGLGRKGIEVSVGNGDGGIRMIFDPRTGALRQSTMLPGNTGLRIGFTGLTQTIAAQGVAASLDSLPAGVKPIAGKQGAPQTLSISPRTGTPSTVFTLTLSPPPARRRSPGPPPIATLDGPTAPGCHAFLMPPPLIRLAELARAAGGPRSNYRLGPGSISRHAWCPGRYLLQLSSAGQPSLYFDVS